MQVRMALDYTRLVNLVKCQLPKLTKSTFQEIVHITGSVGAKHFKPDLAGQADSVVRICDSAVRCFV